MATKYTQQIITEKKPKMLKEFLRDYTNYNNNNNNNNSCSNSCSSSGFKSFPRTNFNLPDNSDPSVQNFLDHQAAEAATLPRSRSRSRAAAEAAFSSFQKLLNAVKSLHSSPTPSTLLSRKFFGLVKKRSKSGEVKIMVVKVKVKDILRWKSFRDLIVDQSQPLDDIVGPTEEVTIGCCSSSESSEQGSLERVDTDFTVTEEEELPCCLGDLDDVEGKKMDEVIASDSQVGPKEDNDKIASDEDAEQQSPVYVLDSPFRDEVSDEEFPSSFDRSLANMERSKQRLLQSIQWFESLAGVHEDDETEATDDEEAKQEDHEQRSEDDHNVIDVKSKAYIGKELCWFKRGRESLVPKKECITEMEKQGKWSKFEEDYRVELGAELEVDMLSDLLDEVLVDLCG